MALPSVSGVREALRFLGVLTYSILLLPALGLAPAARDSAPAAKYRMEVALPDGAEAARLSALGMDIAGVNRGAGTATVIGGEEDLARLTSQGFCVTRTEARTGTPEALADYRDPAEISAALDDIQGRYPDLAQKVTLTDPLAEGHTVYALKITKDVAAPNMRPAFLLDAQHHAREVMTPEIALDAAEYLTSRYESDSAVRRWVDNIVIWIVPSVNPDGAAYVFEHDNWWRRNRSPECPVDINRNYPFNWGACYGSDGYCESEIYRGPSPGSETEVKGLMALMGEALPIFQLSYHSYGQYILTPYGCYDPSEAAVFASIGNGLNAILQDDSGQTGHYATGPGWSTIYTTDGTTIDTGYGEFGIAVFTIEVNCCDFQPDYASLRDITVQRQRTAWQYFLDRTLDAPSVRGRVVDEATGDPVVATVTVLDSPLLHGEAPRRTDARGLYAHLLEPGRSYRVRVEAPGHCSKTATVEVDTAPATLDFTLSPSSAAAPSSPTPVSGSHNLPTGLALSWDDTGADAYEVYFGTTQDPPLAGTTTEPRFEVRDLALGRTYFWRVAVPAPCGTAAGPLWSFSTYPYAITKVTKQGNPFRLVVSGQGFSGLCEVNIDGGEAPVTAFKGESKLIAKGGSTLKAMVPKGKAVHITVEDDAGGSCAPYPFSW